MEDLKTLNASAGQSIPAIIAPTFTIWAPLLLKHKDAIKAVPFTTSSYGSHPRQELDIYKATSDSEKTPVLVFFHGGGLVRGDKTLTQFPESLVYANLGAFFATRGITTVVANYRLVNSPFGGHDAVFPSGGEDVSLILKYLEKDFKGREVYLMGNSAGGVHMSTFLLYKQFLEQRKEYISASGPLHLKGAINLAVPCHFKTATPERSPMLTTYYGAPEEVASKSPCGLLESLEAKTLEEAGLPKMLALVGEFDPQDEIVDAMKDFASLWEKKFGENDIQLLNIEGHNHISPPLALMAGDVQGEKWGEVVAGWILG